MSGDFSPFLLSTNMTYAPQFKNGTVFQPGTITRDGAGNITDGMPFAGNVVPQSMWQPLSANMLKIYTESPATRISRPLRIPVMCATSITTPAGYERIRTCSAWTTRSATK